MDQNFSDRINDVPQSFIREILKVTLDPSIISFAGGLPNRSLFPVQQLKAASCKVFDEAGQESLQYANSEGYLPLRQYISTRYKEKQGLDIPVDNILVTTGSQQGLDLLGKTLLNDGDEVIMEEPGYLGAIQAFSVYRAAFCPVPVTEQGMVIEDLGSVLGQTRPKLLYSVPNFQNPAGISYTEANRQAVVDLVRQTSCLLIQDDPYADLRFSGTPRKTLWELLPDQTILLGSFSKTVAPSLRLGWLVAPPEIMEKLIIAKQASDLHTNYLSQRILHQYLADNELDDHVAIIAREYGQQKDAMVDAIHRYFPEQVHCTNPEGGMFLWVTLPQGFSSMRLFERAIARKVAFVPGTPFYVNREDANTLRLNFSCVDDETIDQGIRRLGQATAELLAA